jgi:PAS domain S-box-containing protein
MEPNFDELIQLRQRLQQQEAQLSQTRQDLLGILNASPEAIFLMQPDGTLIVANEAMAQRVRTPTDQLPGRNIYDFLTPPLAAARRHHVEQVLHTRRLHRFQDDRDGRIIEHTLSPVLDETGAVTRVAVFAQDVTSRLQAEAALHETETQYRRIVDTAREGIWAMDSQRRTTYVNRHMAQMLGYTPAAMLGRPVEDFMFAEDLPGHSARMQQREQGQHGHYEHRFRAADGRAVWALVSATALTDAAGCFAGSFAMFTDISQRKQAERALQESEHRYRTYLLNSPYGVLAADRQGQFVHVNPAACRLTGYGEHELLTMTIMDLHHAQDQATGRHHFRTVLEEGRFQGEMPFRTKSGERRWIALTAIRLRDDRVLGFCHDITERKQAEEALHQSQERLQSLFRVAPVGIGLVQEDRIFQEVNPRVCEMTGYSAEELIGRNARLLYPSQEDYEFVGSEKYRQIAVRGIGVVETRWQHKDGSVIDILMASTPVDPADRAKGTIFTAMDITERKRAEEERRLLQAQLVQAQKLEAIGTLAGGIAHDFNNILGAVIGYAEMARDSVAASTPLARDLDQILRAGNRAKDLVKQILAFSRQAETEPINLYPAPIIHEVITMLRPSLPTTITIEQHIDAEAGPIRIDPTQMHQILMNLCTNAYHALEETGGTLTLSLATIELDADSFPGQPQMRPGSYVHIAVADTGCGIAPTLQKRIFDPFFTTKQTGRGTGMGLSLVHGIVIGNGGGITLESTPDSGSTFHIYLPLAPPRAHHGSDGSDRTGGQGQRAHSVHRRRGDPDHHDPGHARTAGLPGDGAHQQPRSPDYLSQPARPVRPGDHRPDHAGHDRTGPGPQDDRDPSRYPDHPLHRLQQPPLRRKGQGLRHPGICLQTAHQKRPDHADSERAYAPLSVAADIPLA